MTMKQPISQTNVFPGQRSNEHTILLMRRHWIVWTKFIIQLAFFNLVPAIFFLIAYYGFSVTISADGPLFIAIVLLLSFYYLGTWLMYFHQFVDYRLDVWILTDQRIINIEQEGLFARVFSELNIAKVQDVTSELKGHAQTFLDYGNVYIQTAGERQRFIFEHVPHPEEISRLIVKANDAALKLNPQVSRDEASDTPLHTQ